MSFQAMAWAIKQKTGDPASKLLLLMLANYANEDEKAWPSINRLVAECEMSRSTVIRRLEDLERQGLISRKATFRHDGGFAHNVYTLTPPRCQADTTLVSERPDPSVCVTPNPINEPIKEAAAAAPTRAVELPLQEDWRPRPEDWAWAAKAHPTINAEAEFEKFRTTYLAKGQVYARWEYAFRNWIRRTAEYEAKQRTLPALPARRPARLSGAELAERNRQSVRQSLSDMLDPEKKSANRLFQ